MNLAYIWILALAGATAAGLTASAWLAIARVMDELRTFDNFEGMHFE